MKKLIAAPVASILALILAGQTFAAVSNFHFFDPKLLAHTDVQGQTFTPDSGSPIYQATIYGGKLGLPPNANARAYLVDYGLGVMDAAAPNGDRNAYLNRVLVDGSFGAEYIRLVFNEPVQVTQAKFAFAGPFERFDLAVDGVNLDVPALFGSDVIYNLAPPQQYKGTVRFPLDKVPFGTVWDFIAPTSQDSWLLENVDVIPEPATLLIWSSLCLSAFGLRGVRRRVFG